MVILLIVEKCNRSGSIDTKNPPYGSYIDTTTTIKSDTVERIDTVYLPSKVIKVPTPYYIDSVSDSLVALVNSKYRDTVALDSIVTVTYDLSVEGKLKDLKLGYIAHLPVTTITNTVTNNITKTVDNSNGLYVGSQVGLGRLGIGASYLHKGYIVGYNYDLLNAGDSHERRAYRHSLSFSKKIW